MSASRRTSSASRYETIWRTVRRIPPGRVATYGQIAEVAGLPRQPRLVGYALHALPEGSDVPWHRVIGAAGTLSLPQGTAAFAVQRALLEEEGIAVTERGRVDLARHRWSPRSPRGDATGRRPR